jgi:predicted dinucleotide-binding enzyme
VLLAVKGSAAEAVVKESAANLAGKTVIDATNPIADGPPDNGVIRYFTNANESLMERLQKAAPGANFVKAFNSVGNMFMVNPPFKPTPTMFICGNDATAKQVVTDILTKFGWETADMGGVEVARPIEALCQLWCAPGFNKQDWAHAFKYLRLG